MARKGLEVMAHFDYGEATRKLLMYWDKYHVEYHDLIPRYETLIGKKKELGLLLNNAGEASTMKKYPRVYLFEITRRTAVEHMIEDMRPKQIEKLIELIEKEVVEECSYFKLVKKIVQFHETDIKDQLRPRRYTSIKLTD